MGLRKAGYGADTPEAAIWGERVEALLWDGRVRREPNRSGVQAASKRF